jgi:hydroxyacylglutathione hydrolase
MINYHFIEQGTVFTGDTLFTLGCGRIFEGNAEMMWDSLSKLMQLPPETVVYSSHEYTLANANFAVTVDPENAALKMRKIEMEKLRENNLPTVPSTIGEELATNPFLRAGDPAIRKLLGMVKASDSEVFAEIRKRKDNF